MIALLRDSAPKNDAERVSFMHNGVHLIVWKRRVHQWRTDLMIRVDGRDLYLARLEGGMTRGDVKRLAREWLSRRDARSR